ncbi:MAG: helix-turn-helix domain-containing protein [Planctomycetes bacterium]|nr:helix-turn-helix domain-containing protein [Planctomycetota bacterium]
MTGGSQGFQGSQGQVDNHDLLTVDEAAALLRYSTKTIRRQVKARRIPALRLANGHLRFDRRALLAALQGTSPDAMTATDPTPSHSGRIAALADELTT